MDFFFPQNITCLICQKPIDPKEHGCFEDVNGGLKWSVKLIEVLEEVVDLVLIKIQENDTS